MNVVRIKPDEARAKLDEGYVYVDVRTVAEFEAGHPTGAYNVPINHPSFLQAMASLFSKDAKIIVGCKVGGRSLRAAQVLIASGYTDVIDQLAGFHGAVDAFGQVAEPGWSKVGLPVSTEAEPGRSWADLAEKAGIST
jgi:rhodanese-related sulfurtransferase